ncbi:MAG: hypothetical protein DWP97_05250 [Calditrichaeota bacterium]|nr:MAG: hypothetical protein DWP97_05250 [Calditrichota bacterium]
MNIKSSMTLIFSIFIIFLSCTPRQYLYFSSDRELSLKEHNTYKIRKLEPELSIFLSVDAINCCGERRVGFDLEVFNQGSDSIKVFFKNIEIFANDNKLILDRYWLTDSRYDRPVFMDSVDYFIVEPNRKSTIGVSGEHFNKKSVPQQIEVLINNVFKVKEQFIEISKNPLLFILPSE